MICKATYKYIVKEAKKRNIVIDENYNAILDEYKDIVKGFGRNLEFRSGRAMYRNTLNANAGYFSSSSIIATPEWALQLVTSEKKDKARNAFLITLGHEMTHKDKELVWFPHISYMKFFSWINEIHADFGGTQKLANSKRAALLQAIDFKREFKRVNNMKDIEDYTHPSWKRRRFYAENFNFDKKLIMQIAKDTGFKNKDIIRDVMCFFDNIVLE